MTTRCGTVRGYFDHLKVKETTCPSCRKAKNDYQAERREGYGNCTIRDCKRPAQALGLCTTHASRHYQNGDANYRRPSSSELFWRHVAMGPIPSYAPDLGECWLWIGSTYLNGYGKFASPQQYAHRFAYEDLVVEIPEGLQIDHLCRVRNCVRPEHLEPVTLSVNVRRGHEARKALA